MRKKNGKSAQGIQNRIFSRVEGRQIVEGIQRFPIREMIKLFTQKREKMFCFVFLFSTNVIDLHVIQGD